MSTEDNKPAKQSYQLFSQSLDPENPDFLPPAGSIDWSEGLINARFLIRNRLSDKIHDRKYDEAMRDISQAMVELSVVLWHVQILQRKEDEKSSPTR